MIHTARTDEIDADRTRALLERAFAEEVRDADWEHCLGGIHVLAFADGRLIGHAALIDRELEHGDAAIRTGYVEGLAVDPAEQRRGVGGRIMDEIERLIRERYPLGALSSSDEALGFYAARGWLPWQGETAVRDGEEITRTPEDDDALFVMPVSAKLDRSGLIVCDWRAGDVW